MQKIRYDAYHVVYQFIGLKCKFILSVARNRRRSIFSKSELNALLSAYSFRVANGDWRDYALDHMPNKAVFSIFKHAHEHPLFSVEKRLLKTNSEPQFILYDRKKPC